jgi:hypothetical protein
MTIKIVRNEKGNSPGKLADAELHFDGADGVLEGLKLIGFAIWERRRGGGRTVTFPARQYSVNWERRSFALLRPVADAAAKDRLGDLILSAYAEQEPEVSLRCGDGGGGGCHHHQSVSIALPLSSRHASSAEVG